MIVKLNHYIEKLKEFEKREEKYLKSMAVLEEKVR